MTCETVATGDSVDNTWHVAALTAGTKAREAQNRDFCLPHLHSMPPLGGSRRNIAMPFGMKKARMVWLSDGEKNFEDIFIRFDMIHERDRHTYTDRQTPRDGIGRAFAEHRAAKMRHNRIY